MQTEITREACQALDAKDELANFKDKFDLPQGVIYLDGNSLGVLPKGAAERAARLITQEWGSDLIRSWGKNNWFELPLVIGTKISKLIGGEGGGCVAGDTTSINVYKALGAALEIQKQRDVKRRVIVSERENFPTDLYMIEGLINTLGGEYELRLIDAETPLESALGPDVAVVLLTQVNYRSGAKWQLAETTAQVHAAGALIIWDLCHSVGAVEVDLTAANADFAVGCTYKYLNGGPGAPAFIWVADRHISTVSSPLTGWWGHSEPFAMSQNYCPAPDIRRFQVGTQSILALATMEVGVNIALEVPMHKLREKSLALTSLFIDLVRQRLSDFPLTLITPEDPAKRGSHVSFKHPEGFAVMQALISRGVIGDYREPEVMRFGITPLYLSFTDIWDAVQHLVEILENEEWRAPQFQLRGAVT